MVHSRSFDDGMHSGVMARKLVTIIGGWRISFFDIPLWDVWPVSCGPFARMLVLPCGKEQKHHNYGVCTCLSNTDQVAYVWIKQIPIWKLQTRDDWHYSEKGLNDYTSVIKCNSLSVMIIIVSTTYVKPTLNQLRESDNKIWFFWKNCFFSTKYIHIF